MLRLSDLPNLPLVSARYLPVR